MLQQLTRHRWSTLPRLLSVLVSVATALVATWILLWVVDAPPWETLRTIGEIALGDRAERADTIMAWVPLALAAAGLVVTFTAGLWNIGVEGQVIAGAIGASWVAREIPGPGWLVIPLIILIGFVSGGVWGVFAGVLKTRGGVNEIFGGLGLGFVAQSMATYLVIGPWKREGIASTGGTEPFREEVSLPTWGDTRLSWWAVGITVVLLVGVWLMLRGTRFGLRLKAVGENPVSAKLLGVPTEATILRSFLLGGGLAGLAGGVIAIGIQHKLVPAAAGGRGFLAILVVLLAAYRVPWAAIIALFFAVLSVGSSPISLYLDVDSAIGGVVQGLLVLFVVLFGGWQSVLRERREARLLSAPASDEDKNRGADRGSDVDKFPIEPRSG